MADLSTTTAAAVGAVTGAGVATALPGVDIGAVVGVFGGALFGAAPLFDRFFVGDLNSFLPPRAMGLNFSTQPSRNLLGTSIAGHRYDKFAARVLVEYSVPLWRRHRWIYNGDAFIAVGAFGMGGTLVSFEAVETNALASGIVAKVLSNDDARKRVEVLLVEAKETARRLLAEHRHLHEALVAALLERNELVGDEITDVLVRAGARHAAEVEASHAGGSALRS